MKITRTTPAVHYDSFTVEIRTMIGDADGYSNLTLGPFSRSSHLENLENLLQLLASMEKEDFYENYNRILGFLAWFHPESIVLPEGWNPLDTLEEQMEYSESLGYYRDYENEEAEMEAIQKAFAMSKGFRGQWPHDPRSQDGYQQQLMEYKVFYYDFNGVKYNTEVQP